MSMASAKQRGNVIYLLYTNIYEYVWVSSTILLEITHRRNWDRCGDHAFISVTIHYGTVRTINCI